MAETEHLLEQIPDEKLRFEGLVAELSAGFIRLDASQIDEAIENAQRVVCEHLDLDRSALFQRCNGQPEKLLLTHLYHLDGAHWPPVERRGPPNLARNSIWVLENAIGPQHYTEVEVNGFFPWVYQRLCRRETVVVHNVEDLPPEAACDKDRLQRYGTKSTVVVPLFIGAELLGCLTFAVVREPRQWSPLLVRRFEFVAGVFANALARKRADYVLRESQERLALATESAGAGLWSLELETDRVWVTPGIRALFQFAPEAAPNLETFLGKIHVEDRTRVGLEIANALQSDTGLSIDFRIPLANGTCRWISARGRRHCDPSGKPLRLTGASVDVTQRKYAEAQLRESENRFRTLVEQAGEGFELLNAQGEYLDVNAATLQQLGYTREEMLRLTIFDVDPLLKRQDLVEQSRQRGSPFRIESVHRRKDGSTFPVEVTISLIQLESSPCFLTLVRDITERKLAEETLARSYEEIKQLKDRLQAESDYLRAEMKGSQVHGDIVGRSPAIREVLHRVEQVAPAPCPVLVSGETGTGKELIAQEIHRLSPRHDRVMVLVNCAALPTALVESELFGRERGAYTGALTSQVGHFEIANGSTIFMDEVGELSMEVQAKLLRVLQEGEFQRLGSPKTHKVDVRVIAATNRDLAQEVREGRFREDLYYRLNVFPIELPPLRDRVEDIPALVFAFLEELSSRMGKKVTKVSRKTMEILQAYSWPGNIRELRNVIEHSVILSSGELLKLPALGDAPTRESQPVTLFEAEREHILKTLERTGWRIKGPHGAATRLGLQPSTLYSRMQKLGIPHRRQKDEMVNGA